jgi:hypothetical protein
LNLAVAGHATAPLGRPACARRWPRHASTPPAWARWQAVGTRGAVELCAATTTPTTTTGYAVCELEVVMPLGPSLQVPASATPATPPTQPPSRTSPPSHPLSPLSLVPPHPTPHTPHVLQTPRCASSPRTRVCGAGLPWTAPTCSTWVPSAANTALGPATMTWTGCAASDAGGDPRPPDRKSPSTSRG